MYWWKGLGPEDKSFRDFFLEDFCTPLCAVTWELLGGQEEQVVPESQDE